MGTRDGTPAVTEVPLRTVTLTLCVPCLAGEGGECHSPGCALWMNRAPDIPVTQHLTEAETEAAYREWDQFFTRTVGVSPSSVLNLPIIGYEVDGKLYHPADVLIVRNRLTRK